MKKILLTTDFSENSWNAIFTALKLYANVKCKFYIVHAYEPSALNLMGKKSQQRLGLIYDSLSKYAEQELQGILKYLEINHQNPNHSFTAISKPETLEEAVTMVIAENDIDLLITGTQGATGAKEVFLGSNTVKILHAIKKIPVLAVPTGFNFQKLKTIIFATDFMMSFKKNELIYLQELASLWNAEIEVIYVAVTYDLTENQNNNKSILEKRFKGLDYHFKEVPFNTSVSKSIDTYTEGKNAAILGIIRHQHTFWEKVIGEPIVKKIAFHSAIPVLFLPQ